MGGGQRRFRQFPKFGSFFFMVPLKFQDAVLGWLMLLSMVLEASKLKIIGSVYIIPVVCMSSVQSDIIG